MKKRKTPNIVSVHLSPEAKADLDRACDERGMTIKSLLGRLITWFVNLDKTEQSLVLGQMEPDDMHGLASLVLRRRAREAGQDVADLDNLMTTSRGRRKQNSA